MRSRWNVWTVHGMCRSGNHALCKQYEDDNLQANFVCGCKKCNHPKPSREQYEENERRIYGKVRFQDNNESELDSSPSGDITSWFVEDEETEANGHDEAPEPETKMSTTEAVASAELSEDEVVETTAPEAVDAPEADDTVDDTEAAPATKSSSQRKRGELETEVKGVTDKFLAGKIKMPEDKQLTPHYIALAIEQMYGYDEPPSTGAVSAVLKRWSQYNYAEFGEEPFHFIGLTAEGQTEGLDNLRTSFKEARKEERRKEREAKAAAEVSEEE